MKETNYAGQFLIAMPQMPENFFSDALIYICEHNKEGITGLMVNKQTDLILQDIFMQMDLSAKQSKITQQVILLGGPIQNDRGFVLHADNSQWDATLTVNKQASLTSSNDILVALAKGQGPKKSLLALGYCGWEAGQLEQELLRDDWLVVPADNDILFTLHWQKRREAAAKKMGIDLNLFNLPAGHA